MIIGPWTLVVDLLYPSQPTSSSLPSHTWPQCELVPTSFFPPTPLSFYRSKLIPGTSWIIIPFLYKTLISEECIQFGFFYIKKLPLVFRLPIFPFKSCWVDLSLLCYHSATTRFLVYPTFWSTSNGFYEGGSLGFHFLPHRERQVPLSNPPFLRSSFYQTGRPVWHPMPSFSPPQFLRTVGGRN